MKFKNYFFSSGLLKSCIGLLVLLGTLMSTQMSFAGAPIIPSDFIFIPENTTAVRTPVNASDPDGDPIVYSIAGIDAGQFNLTASGDLSFVTAPDFEVPTDADGNNLYNVDITVTDNEAIPLSDTRNFDIRVVDVPEVAIIQGDVAVSEGALIVASPVAVSNPSGGALTYSVSGGADAAQFTVEPVFGTLSFISPPDFENPADADTNNVYEVEITVTDSGGITDSKTILIFITDTPILITIEEPSGVIPSTGIANIRGWAVSFAKIDKMELFIDGVYVSDIPFGSARADVGAAFPTIPDSEKSGFSMIFPYSTLSTADIHTVLVRAHDINGAVDEVSQDFTVVRFDTPFMSNPNSVTIKNANINIVTVTSTGDTQGGQGGSITEGILIEELLVEGEEYTVLLEWQVATQQFEITDIQSETGLVGILLLTDQNTEDQQATLEAEIQPLVERFIVTIEEPSGGKVSNGIANLRGWAVGIDEIEKIELFLGDKYLTDIPFGGTRADVAAAFPGYLNPEASGFSMVFPYSALERGRHTFTVRVHDASGFTQDASVRFPVVRLDSEFISDIADVKLTQASIRVRRDDEKIIVDNFSVRDVLYEVVLKWRVATQQFEIQAISKMPTGDDGSPTGGGPKLGSP